MMPVEKAIEAVLANTPALGTEQVPLDATLGRILAEPVLADEDAPPFERSIMDGYAVIAADTACGKAELDIIEEVFAGDVPASALQQGQAAKIMTGAPVPPGANSVVMVERTVPASASQIRILEKAAVGQNITPKGEFVRKGDRLLEPGIALMPRHLGILAFVGQTHPKVYRRPTCAILSTGDELVDASEEPGPGQIRNSNIHCLRAQLETAGAEVEMLGIGPDNLEQLALLVRKGLEADVFISTGGASVGEKDFIREIFLEEGVQIFFNKLCLRPGKPTLYGRRGDTMVFGLPGNPLSAMVTCELFVLTCLRKLQSCPNPAPQSIQVRMGQGRAKQNERRQYLPATLRQQGPELYADIIPFSASGDLMAVTAATGLAIITENSDLPCPGDLIEFLSLAGRAGAISVPHQGRLSR